jgi:hypothetical protein
MCSQKWREEFRSNIGIFKMNWNVKYFCGRAKTEGSAACFIWNDPKKREQAIQLGTVIIACPFRFLGQFSTEKEKNASIIVGLKISHMLDRNHCSVQ